MPRLARNKATLAWYNDFQRSERKAGDVLANIAKAGLNPADYEEVELLDPQYVTEEANFFAAARAAQAVVEAAEETAWSEVKIKLTSALNLTDVQKKALRQRLLGE